MSPLSKQAESFFTKGPDSKQEFFEERCQCKHFKSSSSSSGSTDDSISHAGSFDVDRKLIDDYNFFQGCFDTVAGQFLPDGPHKLSVGFSGIPNDYIIHHIPPCHKLILRKSFLHGTAALSVSIHLCRSAHPKNPSPDCIQSRLCQAADPKLKLVKKLVLDASHKGFGRGFFLQKTYWQ